jgi:ATP dependent DNA ligase domain
MRVTRPGLGFIEPCLPSPAKAPPSGPGWLNEIKHDGFRIMARRDGAGVRLITRHGNDFTARFPLAVEAVSALSARSFLLGGEIVTCSFRPIKWNVFLPVSMPIVLTATVFVFLRHSSMLLVLLKPYLIGQEHGRPILFLKNKRKRTGRHRRKPVIE